MMGVTIIPTGLEDMPVVFVKTPYIEQTKNRRKILRGLESMTNDYLRELILSRSPTSAAVPTKPCVKETKHG